MEAKTTNPESNLKENGLGNEEPGKEVPVKGMPGKGEPENRGTQTSKTNVWSRKRILRVIRIAVLIAACVAICLTTRGARSGLLFFFDLSGQNGELAGMTEEEKRELMQEASDASAFSFRINGNMSFESGDSEGVLFIENPKDNDCLLRVTITLDGDGRTIYESGYLKPGTGIGRDKLDVSLPKGEYEATAELVACDGDRQETGRAQAGIHITVRH